MTFRINRFFHAVCLLGTVLLHTVTAKPVTVGSLEELMPYLSRDNVEVVMKPGEYWIRGEDALAGKFGSKTFQSWVKTLLPFSGSNSTYDFTGVTIKVETSVGQSLGSFDIYKLQTTGNHIVIKNLKMECVGSVHDAPTRGNLGVCMDGSYNRIEGLHLSTKGSYPYGYGEAFGKGGPSVVSGIKKHSAVLIRGLSNHFKDCTVIHRGYGHALFMQAANKPVIEGCYIEGEMRNSDDILAEKGTGTLGDKVNFMTYFGYPIPPGYSMCTGEEGIRAYNGGQTWIDGEVIEREAQNPTILNCKVVNMRGGVTLTHASGKKYVEGTTTIGCTRGFCIGSGDIVDCYSDTSRGPALGVDYEGDRGMNAEITLLPNEGPVMNGPQYAAFITGRNHNITLKSAVPNPDQQMVIQIGGNTRHIGGLGKVSNYSARNITFNNQTAHPILIGDRVEDCYVTSGGVVTDLGSNNQVKHAPVQQLEVTDEKEPVLAKGESAEYAVSVPVAGTYWIDYRFAAPSAGAFSVSSDERKLETVSFGSAGTARSASPVYLSGQEQVLRITSGIGGLKLKGFSLVLEYPETPVVPSIEVRNPLGDVVRQTKAASLNVMPGQSVVIDPQPDFGGRWSWSGPGGFTSDERVITLSELRRERSGSYVAKFINDAGAESTRTIELNVGDLISVDVEPGKAAYEIDVPFGALYAVGYRVASEAAGSFAVRMDGEVMDEVSFEATGGAESWKTVSSGEPVNLDAGRHTLKLEVSDGAAIDWLRLKALSLVRSDALPMVYKAGDKGGINAAALDAVDISGAGPVDVFVMYRNRNSLSCSYQLDGGKSTALQKMPVGNSRTLASAVGLTGEILKLNVSGRNTTDYNFIEGIYILKSKDRFARIEADDYVDNHGTRVEKTQDEGGGYNVGSIGDGHWLKFSNINLTGAKRFEARLANISGGGSVEVRLNAPDGPMTGKLAVPKTGGWQNWQTVSTTLKEVPGIYDVYLVFGAESRGAGNINWFRFSAD